MNEASRTTDEVDGLFEDPAWFLPAVHSTGRSPGGRAGGVWADLIPACSAAGAAAASGLRDRPREERRHLTITSSAISSVTVTRWFKGCTGRLFPLMSAVNLAICSAESWIGAFMTIHFTPSEQGGVVREPS
jgi:hypothetical protein